MGFTREHAKLLSLVTDSKVGFPREHAALLSMVIDVGEKQIINEERHIFCNE